MNSPCPWSALPINLNPLELTSNEKKWLGLEILINQKSQGYMQRNFSINKKTVLYYSRKLSQGLILHERGGRPNCLDDLSMSRLRQVVLQNANISEDELREWIRMECRLTFERRVLHDVGHLTRSFRKPSQRSVVRYSKVIRLMVAY